MRGADFAVRAKATQMTMDPGTVTVLIVLIVCALIAWLARLTT